MKRKAVIGRRSVRLGGARVALAGGLLLGVGPLGCDDGVGGGAGGADSSAGGAADGTGGASATGGAAGEVPAERAALEAFLAEGAYSEFEAESSAHEGAGPHFGKVRTFVNPSLAASLAAGESERPVGAAAVKELFGDGDVLLGHAVTVKVADGTQPSSWYHYQAFEGSVSADGVAVPVCVSCHMPDERDGFLGPYPLP
jgi:hypothetical protein